MLAMSYLATRGILKHVTIYAFRCLLKILHIEYIDEILLHFYSCTNAKVIRGSSHPRFFF